MDSRRQRFVEEYLQCLNAAEAARRAGYSPKCAKVTGARLLTDVNVRSAIDAAQQKLSESKAITLERWLEELALIGFSNVDQYDVDPGGGITVKKDAPSSAIRAVSSIKTRTHYGPEGSSTVETEYKVWDKLSALEKIGKHLGFYPREFGGEGAPNGRQPLTARRDGEKVILDWGDLKVEL